MTFLKKTRAVIIPMKLVIWVVFLSLMCMKGELAKEKQVMFDKKELQHVSTLLNVIIHTIFFISFHQNL